MTKHPYPIEWWFGPKMSIPDSNNVYGHLVAPEGLLPILATLRQLFGKEQVSIRTSETLRLSSDVMDFESTSLGGGKYLLNGGVNGSHDQVLVLVRQISGALAEASIEHQFEIYDFDGTLVETVPVSSSLS